MNHYYLTFRSVTFAQRGEKLLGSRNIRCALSRTPRWMEQQGCGYALSIWTKDVYSVLVLLQENSIPVRRVYVKQGDGQLEEISL